MWLRFCCHLVWPRTTHFAWLLQCGLLCNLTGRFFLSDTDTCADGSSSSIFEFCNGLCAFNHDSMWWHLKDEDVMIRGTTILIMMVIDSFFFYNVTFPIEHGLSNPPQVRCIFPRSGVMFLSTMRGVTRATWLEHGKEQVIDNFVANPHHLRHSRVFTWCDGICVFTCTVTV